MQLTSLLYGKRFYLHGEKLPSVTAGQKFIDFLIQQAYFGLAVCPFIELDSEDTKLSEVRTLSIRYSQFNRGESHSNK